MTDRQIGFGVIGVDHPHAHGMVQGLTAAGARCLGVTPGDDVSRRHAFQRDFPDVPEVDDRQRLYDDPNVEFIVTAAIPSQRAQIAIEAMRAGKDVLVDKPAAISRMELARISRVRDATRRLWAVYFSERFNNPAMAKARELVASGAIGTVIQTVGLGPHRLSPDTRPSWFFNRDQHGGILTDLASHQADQFLYLTGSIAADVVYASVGNYANPDHPLLQDFGEMVLHSRTARGYVRVDWYTPNGLSTWGDGRIVVLGTDGYIELRTNVDLAGRPGGNHLFLVDQDGEHHLDCSDLPVTFYQDFLDDVRNRTEKATPQQLYITAMDLALLGQFVAED